MQTATARGPACARHRRPERARSARPSWCPSSPGCTTRVQLRNLFDLDPERDGVFDLTLFLGILYHLEDPVRALREGARADARLCVIETQVARSSPALPYMWGPDPEPRTGSAIAVGRLDAHHAAEGGAVVLVPTLEALFDLVRAVGFTNVWRAEPPASAQPQYATGDRVILFAVTRCSAGWARRQPRLRRDPRGPHGGGPRTSREPGGRARSSLSMSSRQSAMRCASSCETAKVIVLAVGEVRRRRRRSYTASSPAAKLPVCASVERGVGGRSTCLPPSPFTITPKTGLSIALVERDAGADRDPLSLRHHAGARSRTPLDPCLLDRRGAVAEAACRRRAPAAAARSASMSRWR